MLIMLRGRKAPLNFRLAFGVSENTPFSSLQVPMHFTCIASDLSSNDFPNPLKIPTNESFHHVTTLL